MADGRAHFDEVVRRRIALERYSTTQIRKTLEFLKELERDLIGKLAGLRADATDRAGRIRLAAQEKLLASIQSIHAEAYARLNEMLRRDMTKLAGNEAGHAGALLSKAASNANLTATTNELSATAAFEIAAARPMQGFLLRDWLDDLEPSHRKRLEAALRISFAEGESLETALARLRGAAELNERGLAALIRTSNTHIAASVAEATYEANADIIEGVEWVSILDSRTTDICRARDGQRYKVGEGPRPPAHIGCRSTTIPVLIGTEPPAREKYPDWLKRQPDAVQDDILGPTRARLFREGRMTVDRFVDMKGKSLTLEELGVVSRDPLFGNYVAQLRTPNAAQAGRFFGGRPEDAADVAARLLGEAGLKLKAEGEASQTPLKLALSGSSAHARIKVTGDGFAFDQMFIRRKGGTIAELKLLSLHEDLQAKKYGSEILRGAVAEYKRLGVTRITLTANIDAGGYVWASFGFKPVSVSAFVASVSDSLAEKVAAGKLREADADLVRALLRRGRNSKDLPLDVARLVNAEGERIGKEALLGTYWDGYLDMTDADALRFFEKRINQK